jgi:hypothetical protein
MKNVFLMLSMFLLMGTGYQLYAQSIPTYPIPSYNVKADEAADLNLYNAEGQFIFTSKLQLSNHSKCITIDGIPGGVYTARVMSKSLQKNIGKLVLIPQSR